MMWDPSWAVFEFDILLKTLHPFGDILSCKWERKPIALKKFENIMAIYLQ